MWQPMEHAPRDGTQILAHTDLGFIVIEWRVVGERKMGAWVVAWDWEIVDDDMWQWVPLPAPPE